ncbi:nose resistant to fluoxetine protein 6-like isoform X1 [Trichoplusia ni]|uniref:Nose resistant to fluoxetine protein 6-like isoform X1 n=1 Tax=Trichoplusia ni TaxID=7111 RepID=A0A7E5WF98_TRINI|nr:nose resistant to fluoxetine protein 6-like isoform X1 [Trichoplusia ni]
MLWVGRRVAQAQRAPSLAEAARALARHLNMWRPVWLVASLCAVRASVVDINDTQFASLPALYALDEWSQCQRAGDVYCMVDAALYATQPSPALMLLQDYSKQTVKHYNRTQVHRGVCVSRCGEHNVTSGWYDAAQACVSAGVAQYGLEAEVLSVDWCMSADSPPASSGPGRSLAVLVTVLAALACLATAVHVLGDRCAKAECNRYLLAFSLKRNYDILTYDRSKPRTDDRMKDVACIEGIRFLGMQCVIFSHVMLIYIYSYIDNPQFVERIYDKFAWQAVLNSPLWLQAFFAMSGFLTAYATLLSSKTKPITFFKCLMSIVNRWIRLTPLAVFALWFTVAWFPLLGSGPQWSWLVTREAHDCSERWWYHVLYVHNHLPTGKFCMGHTWYLAADMQLHVLGVFVLLLLRRWRGAALPLLLLLVTGSALAAGLVVYFYQLTPIVTAQTPEVLRTMFAGSQILTLLYLPAWMNLPGYVGGMGTAMILYYNNIKLKDSKWFNLLFHSSLFLGSAVLLAGAVFLSDSPPPRWAAALYAALDRTLVAVFFCIFMLGCFSRCWSAVRDALEWRGFHTLGRLSYCVFLIHFIVLRITLASNTQLGHASLLSMASLLITSSVLSYIAAVPLCLLVELPLIQLWKAVTEGEGPERTPQDQPPAKPFDLVAQIRRRHEAA